MDFTNLWNQVGLTVWLGDYNGEPQVSLVDERTGERHPCFAPKPRGPQPVPAPSEPDTPF